MKKKKIILIFGIVFATLSCTNDSADDLIDIDPEVTVTYTNTVKSIIDNNCLFCHGATPSNGAPMSLNTYDAVKNAVLNRGLLDRISRAQGEPGMMPLGGTRLPQATINQIMEWNTNNLPE